MLAHNSIYVYNSDVMSDLFVLIHTQILTGEAGWVGDTHQSDQEHKRSMPSINYCASCIIHDIIHTDKLLTPTMDYGFSFVLSVLLKCSSKNLIVSWSCIYSFQMW